jgi:hypothetical protein
MRPRFSRPKPKRKHRDDDIPFDDRPPSIPGIVNKGTQTDGEVDVMLHIWEDTFQEALRILSRVIPCQFESINTIDEKRIMVLEGCRKVVGLALNPTRSSEYKTMESRVAKYEREIDILKNRCHEMSGALQLAIVKKVDPRGGREILSERLKVLDSLLTEEINEQRIHLIDPPPKGSTKAQLAKRRAGLGLLSPSFRAELERQKDGDRTETATSFFDTPITPLAQSHKGQGKRKADDPLGTLSSGKRARPPKTIVPD